MQFLLTFQHWNIASAIIVTVTYYCFMVHKNCWNNKKKFPWDFPYFHTSISYFVVILAIKTVLANWRMMEHSVLFMWSSRGSNKWRVVDIFLWRLKILMNFHTIHAMRETKQKHSYFKFFAQKVPWNLPGVPKKVGVFKR